MSETLEIFGREYTGVTGIKAKDDNGNLVTFIKPEGTLNVSQNGTVDVSQYASANVNVSGGGGNVKLCEIDLTKGNFTIGSVTINSTGAVFDGVNDYLMLPFARAGMTIEIDVASMNLASGTHRRFVMATNSNGFIYRSTGVWAIYNGSWEQSDITDGDFFNNSTVKIYIDSDNKWHIYKNNVLVWEPVSRQAVGAYADGTLTIRQVITLGSISGQSILNTTITGVRIY